VAPTDRTPHRVLVTIDTIDAEDAHDLVRWALEASEPIGTGLRGVDVVPDDAIVIDLARFERLRAYVTAAEIRIAAEARFGKAHDAVYDQYAAAEQALLPTDTDPLP
jgi:hypothetical protein